MLGQRGDLGMGMEMTSIDQSEFQTQTLVLCPDLANEASSSDSITSSSLKALLILVNVNNHLKLLQDASATPSQIAGSSSEYIYIYKYLQFCTFSPKGKREQEQ